MRFFLSFLLSIHALWALPNLQELQKEAKSVDWKQSVSFSVIINAPVQKVWAYVSDSTKAQDWSVYFTHISPLPGISDGKIGATRRCFRNADERGARWDEMTIESQSNSYRIITTYNLQGFFLNFLATGSYVFVRQLYEVITPSQTKLSFQTNTSPKSNWLERLLFRASSKRTLSIFEKNLINIKNQIEGQPRSYPWDPKL